MHSVVIGRRHPPLLCYCLLLLLAAGAAAGVITTCCVTSAAVPLLCCLLLCYSNCVGSRYVVRQAESGVRRSQSHTAEHRAVKFMFYVPDPNYRIIHHHYHKFKLKEQIRRGSADIGFMRKEERSVNRYLIVT